MERRILFPCVSSLREKKFREYTRHFFGELSRSAEKRSLKKVQAGRLGLPELKKQFFLRKS
jgi:hypothetical protein